MATCALCSSATGSHTENSNVQSSVLLTTSDLVYFKMLSCGTDVIPKKTDVNIIYLKI